MITKCTIKKPAGFSNKKPINKNTSPDKISKESIKPIKIKAPRIISFFTSLRCCSSKKSTINAIETTNKKQSASTHLQKKIALQTSECKANSYGLPQKELEKILDIKFDDKKDPIKRPIYEAIKFLRDSFSNGTYLQGCCGPFSELIQHKLKNSCENIDTVFHQLTNSLPHNHQRHAVLVVRDTSNPDNAYLIDSTVLQFDKMEGETLPVKPSTTFPKEINTGIIELRELGFTKITEDFARV